MFKMLVLDLDGTLVGNSGRIAETDKAAVRAAEDAGITVVLASARPYAAVAGVLKELALADPYVIAGSGASVWRAAEDFKFFGHLMTPQQVKECAKFALRHGCDCLAVREDGSYYAQEFNASTSFYGDTFRMQGFLVDFERDDCNDCCKVMLFTPPDAEAVSSCMERMKRELPECGVSKTWANILEFYPSHEVSKERAMARLASHLGIDMTETVAIGDDLVDIGMIRSAGLGIAMANADEAVKAAADFVTRSNDEGGVAHVVFTRLLNRKP
ncbi:MAG: Cof-type HAD-IIB family hydrolase [Christensenellales bacterium]|jgi:Cof subfamily protein (haloacid dehalogenase superfamily)